MGRTKGSKNKATIEKEMREATQKVETEMASKNTLATYETVDIPIFVNVSENLSPTEASTGIPVQATVITVEKKLDFIPVDGEMLRRWLTEIKKVYTDEKTSREAIHLCQEIIDYIGRMEKKYLNTN
jgi:hypothetical protein